MPRKSFLIVFTVLLCCKAWCQDGPGAYDKAIGLPGKFFNAVNRKTTSLEADLTKQTRKYLQRLSRTEHQLQSRLSEIDSSAAKALSKDIQGYTAQAGKITAGSAYEPYADSLRTMLFFLQQNKGLLSSSKDIEKVNSSLAKVTSLQSKLQESEQVKMMIDQRKQLIREVLARYKNLPGGVTKYYNDFNKEAHYYTQQVNDIRSELNTPDRLLQHALSLLNGVKGFQTFMQQYGVLAGMFGIPANYGSSAGMAGLQTRDQVQQLLQTQLGAAGGGTRQYLQAAEAQLNQLKDKLPGTPFTGNGPGGADMPGFTPNNQRTKPFLKRLEYGTNLQTTKSNYFFPTTSDIGLSVGYKLNDKSTIGIGASTKMGWGKDIRHIAVTMEGAGLRSFVDIKLKGSFYASGGYEYNYQPTGILAPGGEAGPVPAWQPSGLAGISKLVSLKSKLFKKTKLQLLWDFLGYRQVPRGQPLKFRVGYVF